jgi:hypothetical protein
MIQVEFPGLQDEPAELQDEFQKLQGEPLLSNDPPLLRIDLLAPG